MAFSQDNQRIIFDRIEWRCHISRGYFALCAYDKVDNHEDCEAEHPKPKSIGGTELLNH